MKQINMNNINWKIEPINDDAYMQVMEHREDFGKYVIDNLYVTNKNESTTCPRKALKEWQYHQKTYSERSAAINTALKSRFTIRPTTVSQCGELKAYVRYIISGFF